MESRAYHRYLIHTIHNVSNVFDLINWDCTFNAVQDIAYFSSGHWCHCLTKNKLQKCPDMTYQVDWVLKPITHLLYDWWHNSCPISDRVGIILPMLRFICIWCLPFNGDSFPQRLFCQCTNMWCRAQVASCCGHVSVLGNRTCALKADKNRCFREPFHARTA